MTMLDANLKGQLATYLERVSQPVELRASLDDSAKSQELRAFLEDIEGLSDKIALVDDTTGTQRVPSFAIARSGTNVAVRFAGIPLGHEFTSLVLALLQVGGHPPKLDHVVTHPARALRAAYKFENHFSLSAQNFPEAVP